MSRFFYHTNINKSILRLLFFLMMCLLGGTVPGYSQFGGELSYWTVFDGNAFRNYEELSDVVYEPRATFYYDIASESMDYRIFYEGSLYLFDEFSSRQFHNHSVGVVGSRYVTEEGSQLRWGINGGKRFNRVDYQFYDFRHAAGYVNLRLSDAGRGSWLLGIRGHFQDYDVLPEFSFWETGGFVRRTFFFATKTTLIARVGAGIKKFTQAEVSEETIQQNVPAGHGKGKGKGNNQGEEEVETQVILLETPGEGIFQWLASLRIAQSLGNKTGLAFEGSVQRNPGDGGRVLIGQDSGYESDEDLFDDPYSYDSDELLIELTRMLPWNTQFKAGFEVREKRYDRFAYDSEGEPVEGVFRDDTQRLIWVSLRKSFPVKGLFRTIAVVFNYTHLTNISSDVYFDYANQVVGLGMHITI